MARKMANEPIAPITPAGIGSAGLSLSFATAIPARWQYVIAYGLVLLLACFTLVVIPNVNVMGPVFPTFMAAYQAVVIVAGLVTAILLFILYREMAQADLLVLGSGYLLCCFLNVLLFLSFPGVMAEHGVLGGDKQTPTAIWMMIHAAFPIAVILAMYLRSTGARNIDWVISLFMALLTVGVILLLAFAFATPENRILPQLVPDEALGGNSHFLWSALVAINLIAATVLGFNMDRHSVLTLWLFLGTVAFTMDVILAWQTNAPFTVGWYAGRVLEFVGSTVLAGIFIIENALLLRNSVNLAGELQKALSETQAATLSKTRFFAAVSHDLRQPFQAMRLFQGVLEQSKPDDRQQAALELLGQAMNNAESLLNELMDFARVESKNQEIGSQIIDLRDMIDEIASDLKPLAEDRGLSIRVRGAHFTVSSDRGMVKRILLNLAGNAIRYTEKGGVLLTTRKRGGQVAIEVWDTGIGIAEQNWQKIFEEFYQVGNPSRDRSQGSGLGLAIVLRLAAALGCSILLNSRLGKGSCFTLAFANEAEKANPGAETH